MTNTLKIRFLCIALSPLFLMSSCGDDEVPVEVDSEIELFINEINPSGSPDWLEIYNPGSAAVDLSGFFIYDDPEDKYPIPSGTMVPANGYLVMSCDGTGVGLNTNFKLTTAGETVSLESNDGALVDRVTFPEIPSGGVYARFGDGTDNFQISGLVTKGASNGEASVVAVKSVSQSLEVVTISDVVVVTAELTSSSAVSLVQIDYSIDDVEQTAIPMTAGSGGNIYTGTIPAITNGGRVEYAVKVIDTASKEVVSGVFGYLVNNDVLPNIVINEYLASNSECCADNDGVEAEFDDWIEIYNTGSTAINLAGFYVSDDPLKPFLYKIPDTDASKTTVEAGGYLILWADKTLEQGPHHIDFRLSAAGETIVINYIDGRTIDSRTFAEQNTDVSEGRETDGSNTWTTFANPSPASAN